MLNVSAEYMESMKYENNNMAHKYTIKNITRKLDLTELLINESFIVSRFLRTAQGTMSPNTVQLELLAEANTPADVLVKDFHRAYVDFKGLTWKEIIYQENIEEFLVRIGDLIVIEDTYLDEKITIFKGKVKNVVKTDTLINRNVSITIDDNTIKGYEYFFSDDVEYENHYIYNSADKEHSLLYILCTQFLGFKDDELDIQDIKDEEQKHIIIPIAKFQKGTKIMEEMAQLVRSFYGNVYTMPNGNLKINSLFDRSYINKLDITLGNKKGNYPVLYFIENSDITPTQNKVEVKYSNSVVESEQVVANIKGQHSTSDDSKLKVPKNKNGEEYWRIEFNNVTDINKTPIVKAYTYNSESTKEYITYTDYEIDFNNKVAKVKFNNNTDKDIFIEKFEFTGKPISIYNDNSVSYTEVKNLSIKNTNLKVVQHKYIISKEQATMLAKHTFYNECRPYNKIRLRTNNLPFLELEDVIKLDFKKYKGDFQIIAINQNNLYTELVLKEYKDYQANPENFITEKSNNSSNGNDFLSTTSNKASEEKINLLKNDVEELKTLTSKLKTIEVKNDKLTEELAKLVQFMNKNFDYDFKVDTPEDLKRLIQNKQLKEKTLKTLAKLIATDNDGVRKILIENPDIVVELSKNDPLLNTLYNNHRKTMKGASATLTGQYFFIFEISFNNAFNIEKYGYAKAIDGSKHNWHNYYAKFSYFKAYPKFMDYARNDTEDDDYIVYV